MAENVTELASKNEFDGFIKDGLVLVDFFADWCMPCIMMAPVMDELGKTFNGKIKVGKINVDENRELSQQFKVVSIPNFILFEDGEVKEQFIGAMQADDFEEKLKKHI